jgi:hypothetical protein
MLKGMLDIFAMVVNFISSDRKEKHVPIGLCEMIDTIGITVVPRLQKLLDKFVQTKKWLFM